MHQRAFKPRFVWFSVTFSALNSCLTPRFDLRPYFDQADVLMAKMNAKEDPLIWHERVPGRFLAVIAWSKIDKVLYIYFFTTRPIFLSHSYNGTISMHIGEMHVHKIKLSALLHGLFIA